MIQRLELRRRSVVQEPRPHHVEIDLLHGLLGGCDGRDRLRADADHRSLRHISQDVRRLRPQFRIVRQAVQVVSPPMRGRITRVRTR